MKKINYIFLVMAGILLVGCSNGDAPTVVESEQENDVLENTVADETAEDEDSQQDSLDEGESVQAQDEPVVETKYVSINLSSVKETHREGASVTPLNLKIESEEENGIDWANEWYDRNHLSLPMIGDDWDIFYDDTYEYQWIGEELYICEKETGDCLYVLDYPTDKWYINGNNACLKDGIFYGASVTNGYAQPDSCYLFAYDLENEELLWRSADQTYNSMNFVMEGDVIICGYGFTAETDYLYQINKNTGEVLDRLELKKMPDLIVEQDGKLYVHTYSYDYVIDMGE